MNEHELIQWLTSWVAGATGAERVDPTTPLETYGLSSRDAVILSGELEQLLDRRVDPTIAYQYPTITALAAALTAPEKAAPVWRRREAKAKGHDIAILGSAGRFPGAKNTDEFWQMLIEGRGATGPLPASRWNEYLGDPVVRTKMSEENTAGGYMDGIASFDHEFFGVSPLEAQNMDPQQRIMLEVAWEALEDAGLAPSDLRGEPVGVFVGSSNNDYGMLIAADPAEAHPYALTGASSAVIPNRISYAFDFRGPSMNVDTACSSSLVSVHHAVRALRDGEADVALAGGVNILANPFASLAFSELGVISPTGRIHAFSDDADGLVRADAAGFIVLKRVDDAIADGDRILAVIKGSATNSDGHSNGLTAPNPEAQVDVLRRAYDDAGVNPQEVDLVEAHGTGTILGDPIEATALGEVLGRGRAAESPLLLGSAKSNIGHSESAAGVVAMIKVLEALKHDTIPESINFTAPNHYVDFDAERIEVVQDPREWPRYSGRRVAGVSGFGFGGTNAHIVVADFDPADYDAAPTDEPAFEGVSTAALPVTGLLPSRRKEAAGLLADFLDGRDDADLIPVARSLAKRNHGRSAAVIQAATTEEAVKRLRQVADGKIGPGIAVADAPTPMGPVFVYSGFGSQHRKMAKELISRSPLFARRMRELDEMVQFHTGWSMLDIIDNDELTYDTENGQVTITAIQIAQTDLLAAAGITPAATMGMSMGEIAAAYGAGGLSAEDCILIATARARLMGEGEAMIAGTDQEGAMAVVELSREDLAEFVDTHAEAAGVEPAVYAGPGMTTVGGPGKAVDYVVAALEAEEKFARKLNVRGAGHTSALDPIMGDLAAEIAGIDARPLRVPLFTSVDRGEVYQPGQIVHDDKYFLRMTRQPVYFQDAIEAAFNAGHSTLVEITPNPVALMGMMNTAFAAGKPDAQLLFTTKRKVDELESLMDLAAKLYVGGMDVDFGAFYGAGETIEAPKTAFKQVDHWTPARPSSASTSLLGSRVTLPNGDVAFSTAADQVFSPHQLIEAAAAEIADARVVATEEHGYLPADGEVTTVVTTSLGGLSIRVYDAATLVAEGFASTLDVDRAPVQGVMEPSRNDEQPAPAAPDDDIDEVRWDPASGETVAERLRGIVSESMGYDPEDLPDELPLIDLGLDSLMGMRIKNRVENDFQIPPLQVQTLRDASVADVIRIVEDAVAGRTDEPQPLAYNDEARDPAAATEKTQGVGVAPRDASERMVFGAWAKYAGAAAAGVTSPLSSISKEQAGQIAAHLTERSGIEVTVDDVLGAETLEPLANLVREGLETPVDGNIRVFREGTGTPVFVFHPAGGSSSVYAPLARRLDDDVPVYGVERLEGSLEERAAEYVKDIERIADGRKVVLAGWSFGGALAYEVAHQLGNDKIDYIALLDTTQPSEPIPDTLEETKARWGRYAAFAKETYGLEFDVPYELLETAGEDALLQMLTEFLATTDASEHGLAAGVLEHQRASFVDNQILNHLDFTRWADVDVPVLLFRSERMHDGAIQLEPNYAHIDEDGGWGAIVNDLTIVHLPGDHLAVVDEPAVGIVGKHMNAWIEGKR
ncbi:type I polyketide synthase [Corynebacterium lujinxingii]|uniref:Alpha/beta fold hydrolase n=1 Tax=Corynebacterium lujinxingii TaxID=2763010 RepID=A0A7H0JYH0_9CORY|nr:type I polyketide synthase [Corynebacterium lujinxingii]MBC3178207.1 alpha/beta fold hydrolase [Corynebacterium lujinxingii]NNO10914.1 alpha/beta fold hydrolase [Corynebacterium lujinxingii]QNP90086.1 alpha/beta fold hydrolase [Corynebacterium lujinxingii]